MLYLPLRRRDLSESTTPSSPADTPSWARQIGRREPHANSAGETPVASIALNRVPLIYSLTKETVHGKNCYIFSAMADNFFQFVRKISAINLLYML
jgi:hypothetical protein